MCDTDMLYIASLQKQLHDTQEENQALKRLLSLSLAELKRANFENCATCSHAAENCSVLECDYHWRHEDEALKLIK